MNHTSNFTTTEYNSDGYVSIYSGFACKEMLQNCHWSFGLITIWMSERSEPNCTLLPDLGYLLENNKTF